MLVRIKKDVQELCEIATPAYYSHGKDMFKITSAFEFVEVRLGIEDHGVSLRQSMSLVSLIVSEGVAIEQILFDSACKKILERLTQQSIEAVTNQR